MGEDGFRKKVTWFTFAFSLFVVWIHSYNAELFLGRTEAGIRADCLERLIGESLGQIAVPGFFVISAYLFHRNFSWTSLKRKWVSRFHSILVPYLLWNAIYYLGYVIGSRLPFLERVIGKGQVPFNLSVFVDSILHFRYLYVFWYLKQLILLILLAPVLYWILSNFWRGLIFLGAVFGAVWVAADLPLLNEDALFYYGFGAFTAIQGRQLEQPWSRRCFWIGVSFAAAGIVNACLTMRWFLPGTTVLYRLLIPAGLWLMVDGERLPAVRPWMECSFFLYAVHFALVRLINKTAASLLTPPAWFPVALFLALPFLMAAISYGAARLMRRFVPGVWRVLNGRR